MTYNEALIVSSVIGASIPSIPAVLAWVSARRAHKEVRQLRKVVAPPMVCGKCAVQDHEQCEWPASCTCQHRKPVR